MRKIDGRKEEESCSSNGGGGGPRARRCAAMTTTFWDRFAVLKTLHSKKPSTPLKNRIHKLEGAGDIGTKQMAFYSL
jgi:hypothetical protein